MRFVTFTSDGICGPASCSATPAGRTIQVVDLAHPAMRDALRAAPPQVLGLIEAGWPMPSSASSKHADFPAAARFPAQRGAAAGADAGAAAGSIGIAHNYNDALAERGMAPPDRTGAVHEGSADGDRAWRGDRASRRNRRRHL